jgi:hypothetical protein
LESVRDPVLVRRHAQRELLVDFAVEDERFSDLDAPKPFFHEGILGPRGTAQGVRLPARTDPRDSAASCADIPTIPGELFAKFQTSFYADAVDAVFKAIRVQ